jgi:hypothetical protein
MGGPWEDFQAKKPSTSGPWEDYGAPAATSTPTPDEALSSIPKPAGFPPPLAKDTSGVLKGKPSLLIQPEDTDPRAALGTAVGAKVASDVPNFLKSAITPLHASLAGPLIDEGERFASAVKTGKDPGAATSIPDFLSKATSTAGSAVGVDTNKLAEAARNRDIPSMISEGAVPLAENYALGRATGAIGKVSDVASELNPLKGPMKASGIGLSPVEKLTKAGGPSVTEANFPQAVEKAAPRLVEQNAIKPIKSVQDMADAAHEAADRLWKDTVEPQIAKHGSLPIDGNAVSKTILSGVDEGMRDLFPKQAKDAEDFASKFSGNLPLSKAATYVKTLNAKLKSYYKMSPEGRAAANVTDGDMTAMSDAADALRDQIYSKLEAAGEKNPADTRLQYGALKQIQKVFQKRAIVAGRQAPLNLQQALALMAGAGEAAGAVATGHPMAAAAGVVPPAIATGLRYMNSPDSLTRRGVAGLSAPPPTPGVVLPSAIGAAARQQPVTLDKLKKAAQMVQGQ